MPDSTFFSTAAQVLPLFALTLAAERRLGVHERSTDPTLDAVIGIALIASVGIGEYSALAALTGRPTHAEATGVEISLGLSGVLLLIDLVARQVSAHKAHHVGRWQRRLVLALATAVIAGAAVVLLVGALAAELG